MLRWFHNCLTFELTVIFHRWPYHFELRKSFSFISSCSDDNILRLVRALLFCFSMVFLLWTELVRGRAVVFHHMFFTQRHSWGGPNLYIVGNSFWQKDSPQYAALRYLRKLLANDIGWSVGNLYHWSNKPQSRRSLRLGCFIGDYRQDSSPFLDDSTLL